MAVEAVAHRERKRSPGQIGRDQLARVVVVASFLTILLLVTTLLGLVKYDAGTAASSVAEKAFNAILPVLAGWVGTVLAFYFSSASQEHTGEMLEQTLAKMSGRPEDVTLVSEKMIPLPMILGLKDLNETAPGKILLKDLQAQFKGKDSASPITRLMFLDGLAFKYLLHVGPLNAFLVDNANPPAKASEPGAPSEPARADKPPTFQDLLDDPKVLAEISTLVVFVPVTSTLAQAKAELDKKSGAQDIIITATGKPAEPVLGWLTNVDLTKALTIK